jgi:6-phosphofructokinase 1
MNVGILFAIGGDGTLRGAQALSEEIKQRNLKIGVIGIPKTIDNDISFVQRSFGFVTAVSEATTAIYAAHTEAEGARNGIGLVKLMGRHAGFIAAHATLANSDVNFCLVPEAPFTQGGFLKALEARLETRHHAVVVVAEGAGQDLMDTSGEKDASGNIRLGDIGLFLKDQINGYFKKRGRDISLKYIDPSYIIRSMPASPPDSAFCLVLAHNAVHAGMAGRTNMVVAYWRDEFTYVPISAAVSVRKQIDPKDKLWTGVLSSTGQPREMN